jgi:hypothetical protein
MAGLSAGKKPFYVITAIKKPLMSPPEAFCRRE